MSFGRAFRAVFSFFWFAGRKARRTRLMALAGILPVLAASAIQVQHWVEPSFGPDGLTVFSNIILAFYLQFLIIILALFYGTSVVSEEVEGRTLPYLTTRPLPKAAVILGKYAAYAAWSSILVGTGTFLSFLILNLDRLAEPAAWAVLAKTAAVLILGLLVYAALFTLAGAALKKSILVGLAFGFGWETIVQYLPGSTQKFTVVHYLKSILKSASQGPQGKLAFLSVRLQPSSLFVSLLTLGLIGAAALAAAVFLFKRREYLFEE
ncbi:MAG: ABC transporter permease [Acidobacteriota bacterium]|nr:ABC transporter permease [Acidobacteriota bacterium]